MRLDARWAKLALILATVALLATACRSDGDVAEDAEDAVDEAVSDAEDAADDAADEVEDAADDAEDAADDAADDADDAADDADGAADDAPAGDIATDVGVTDEPCPDAVNPDNGCIYLGQISDLTVGPFVGLAVPITDAIAAFWQDRNEQGGIGGYDVDATTYTRDNQYNPEVHSQQYEEIKGDVLALAQSLGSPTTFAIQGDLEANDIVTVPVSWTSAWLFSTEVVEAGNTYCIEAINGLDFLNGESPIESITAIHYPGDYGDDGAAGAEFWAEQNGVDFTDVPTVPGQDNQAEAIAAATADGVDVVLITTGPSDAGTIVGQAAAAGATPRFLFNSPSYNPGLLDSPAVDAVTGLVTVAGPWQPYETDTPGHAAMREVLGEEGNDGLTSGWVWSYNMLAILEQAIANGDLTRAGMVEAVSQTTEVDYQGMLPEGSGNLGGEGLASAVLDTSIARPSADVSSGLVGEGYFQGETVANLELSGPCYEGGIS